MSNNNADNNRLVTVSISPILLDSFSEITISLLELEKALKAEIMHSKNLQKRLNALVARNAELEIIAKRSEVRDIAWLGIITPAFPLIPGLIDVNAQITNTAVLTTTIDNNTNHNNKRRD